VHALHDPTEGGLVEGIRELCTASGVGAHVREAAIPIFEETWLLAEPFGIDPLGVIASGALLLAVDPGYVAAVRDALAARSIACAEIGRLIPAGEPPVLERADGSVVPLPRFHGDEIGKIFA
jgi:hydrogenase maturation factor